METFDWHVVWEKKGLTETTDLSILNGYEQTEISPKEAAQRITQFLGLKKEDKVLEVGCGAGAVAAHLGECDYVGVDYAKALVQKHIQILNHQVLCCEANNLIFKDKSFDIVFCFSVFQYFPSQEYAQQVMEEMKRVARKVVLISDLAIKSHRKEHAVYEKSFFKGWDITEGFHSSNGSIRFNASFDFQNDRFSEQRVDKKTVSILF
jgi:ubiquinone/menaquinone biosynthesis C-methylase UbiE